LRGLPKRLTPEEVIGGVFAGNGDRDIGGDDDKQQTADREDNRDRANLRDQLCTHTVRRLRLDFPDCVQRVLDLLVDAEEAKNERHKSERRRDESNPRRRGALHHYFDGLRGRRTESARNLMEDHPFGIFPAERHARDGDRDHRNRRYGQHDVKRECRTETGGVISSKCGESLVELREFDSQADGPFSATNSLAFRI
jgi:hypothetical protein